MKKDGATTRATERIRGARMMFYILEVWDASGLSILDDAIFKSIGIERKLEQLNTAVVKGVKLCKSAASAKEKAAKIYGAELKWMQEIKGWSSTNATPTVFRIRPLKLEDMFERGNIPYLPPPK